MYLNNIAGCDISYISIFLANFNIFFLCEQINSRFAPISRHFTMHFRNILQVVFHSLHLFQPIELKTKCSLGDFVFDFSTTCLHFQFMYGFLFIFFLYFFLHHLILNLCISGISV